MRAQPGRDAAAPPAVSRHYSRHCLHCTALHCCTAPSSAQVSAIVRAPPSDVFRSLVQQRKHEGLGVLMGARTVEKIDANTQVGAAQGCQRWRLPGCFL